MRAISKPSTKPMGQGGLGILRLSRRVRSARGIALSLTVAAAVAYLLYLHSLLLAERLSDLSILEPVVAGKWLASLLILAGLRRFRQAGIPLFRGRKALVVWTLVLLLHFQFPAPIGAEVGLDFDPQQNVFLTFLLPALVSISIALAVCSDRFSRIARKSSSYRTAAILLRRRLPAKPILLAGYSAAILSRPPPA